MISRPLLCARAKQLSDIRFPVLCTPKIDGIRCLVKSGTAVTRAFKLLPNRYVRSLLSRLPEGLDGELVAGNFQKTQSNLMSREGQPDFAYRVFDNFADPSPYKDRIFALTQLQLPSFVDLVVPALVESEEEFLLYEDACLRDGYEGVVARQPFGPYKQGRSTRLEGIALKWKRISTSEAIIYGFEEQMENQNAQVTNVFGRNHRPGGKAEHVPKGTLGSFLVRDLRSGVEFSIGTGIGLTQELRQTIWDDQPSYLNRIVSYKYQDVGIKEKPRFPVWLGFRAQEDMS